MKRPRQPEVDLKTQYPRVKENGDSDRSGPLHDAGTGGGPLTAKAT